MLFSVIFYIYISYFKINKIFFIINFKVKVMDI
nr:MAG TPA: hypothetical protein [Bacteriophage sp.]